MHISVSHRVEIPATFAQTGHPFLDTRPMSHPKDSPWSKTSQKWLVCKLSRIGWGKKKFHCLFFIFFSGIVCGIHLIQLGFSCLLFVYITLRCKSISNGPTIRYPRYPFGVWLLNCPPPMVQLRLFGYGLPSSLPQDIIPWHSNGSNFSKLAWGCWTYITRLGGTIHRIGWWENLQEPLYLVKTMVSCRFSNQSIEQ